VSGHERGAPGGMKIAAVSVGFPVQGFRGCGHKGGTGVPAPDCGSAAIPSRPAATPRPAQKRTVTGRMPVSPWASRARAGMPVSPWRRSTRRLHPRRSPPRPGRGERRGPPRLETHVFMGLDGLSGVGVKDLTAQAVSDLEDPGRREARKNPLQTDLVCRELRKPPARIAERRTITSLSPGPRYLVGCGATSDLTKIAKTRYWEG
jgi:hypothetical protein